MEADALRLIRVFHALNRSQLAERVGISPSYVTELESGIKRPSLEVIEKYARAFGMPVSSLLLFSEKLGDNSAPSAKLAIGGKVVQLLNWIATISTGSQEDDAKERKSPPAKGQSTVSDSKPSSLGGTSGHKP